MTSELILYFRNMANGPQTFGKPSVTWSFFTTFLGNTYMVFLCIYIYIQIIYIYTPIYLYFFMSYLFTYLRIFAKMCTCMSYTRSHEHVHSKYTCLYHSDTCARTILTRLLGAATLMNIELLSPIWNTCLLKPFI